MSSTLANRLAELGHKLPPAPDPLASYMPTRRSGNVLYVSGQISQRDGQPTFLGRVGGEVTPEDGVRAAEAAALGALAHISAATGGELAAVHQVLRLNVFVAATPEFTGHPQVANGASDLFVAVFGDSGRHTRVAVGVASLPRGVCVEVDAVVELNA